jgi:hypothetical protein
LASKAKSSRRKLAAVAPADANESRAAVALTVGWMLSVLSTLAALAVAALVGLATLAWPAPEDQAHPLAALAGMMLFVAIATGLLCLALTPLALRVRQIPPPLAITIGAVLIGLAPLVTFAVFAILG